MINGPCQTRSVVVRMLDPLIVVDVVARKRCAVSLAFDVNNVGLCDMTLCHFRLHWLVIKLSS